jgi:hypothetical protein
MYYVSQPAKFWTLFFEPFLYILLRYGTYNNESESKAI